MALNKNEAGENTNKSKLYISYVNKRDQSSEHMETNHKLINNKSNHKISNRSSVLSMLSTLSTTSSNIADESDDFEKKPELGDRYLSTVLKMDREHNMFGLANQPNIPNKKLSKQKLKKPDKKPVFYQSVIVQVCHSCCADKSQTDLPTSLKCRPCASCVCADPACLTCRTSCRTKPKPNVCPASKNPCLPSKCVVDCATCYGLTVSLKKKPIYEPSPIELTPKVSCELHKPLAARVCTHTPQCVQPSSCFPYLMPCFWPGRPGASCSDANCFHRPPCSPRRRPTCVTPCPIPIIEPSAILEGKNKCDNVACGGRNPMVIKAVDDQKQGQSQNSAPAKKRSKTKI